MSLPKVFRSEWIRFLLTAIIVAPQAVAAAEVSVIASEPNNPAIISVIGRLEFGDEKQFIKIALIYSDAIVLFRSDGGNLHAGIELGRAIRLKGFKILVPDDVRCASACALAWLGGQTRFMSDRALVGFHAAYMEKGGIRVETGVGNALAGAYLNQLGLSSSAVEYITQADPQSMTWLTFNDAVAHGIDVRRFSFGEGNSRDQFSQSRDTPAPSGTTLPDTKHRHQSPETGREDRREVARAVANLDAQYRRSGMTGLKDSVEACYARFAAKPDLRIARYCFALDDAAMRLDQAMAATLRGPPNPYFTEARVNRRASWAFDRLSVDQASRGLLLGLWSRLSAEALANVGR
jgi:hypothetical protein